MKDNRITIAILLAVLVVVVIMAFVVFGDKETVSEQNGVPAIAEVQLEDTTVPVETGIIETEEVTQDSETAVPAVENIVLPTVRTGLESTNPASVNLASGDLQLIEFFAFW